MPKKLEREIKAGLRKAHPNWPEDKIRQVTFATMNKQKKVKKK